MTTTPETPPTPELTPAPPPPARPRLGARIWKWTQRLLLTGLVLVLIAIATGTGLYLYYSRDLPSVEALRNYQPPQVTKVTCADGSVCAEFYNERRTLVDIEDLPKHVRDAFLAAEDADFYQHEGLDFFGITRAAIKNLIPGSRKSGASTITQQVVKNLLLTPERSFARKAREWILTPRVEEALTKDQILNLYINQIYYGQRRYGLEEAALYYFGKHAKDLSIAEAAVLGGTPQSPHRINPETNIVRAKSRERYVLGQLAQHGFLPQEVVAAEMDKPIVLAPRPPPPVGAYYAEEIRRTLIERYGEKAALEGGLRVELAMGPKLRRWRRLRCARAWRRWIGARATAGRWARWSPRASSGSRRSSPTASRRQAGGRRRPSTWRISPRWPRRARSRRRPPTRAPRSSGRSSTPRARLRRRPRRSWCARCRCGR
jgi:penicillin-binding protein 1A